MLYRLQHKKAILQLLKYGSLIIEVLFSSGVSRKFFIVEGYVEKTPLGLTLNQLSFIIV
jgi:hypothetical protein